MPPLPVITNTYRLAMLWNDSDVGNAVNVMHFRKASSTPADLYAAWHDDLQDSMFESVHSNARIVQVDILPLNGTSPTVSFPTDYLTNSKLAGGCSGQAIPAQATGLTFRTAKRGRSYRGRLYLPWVAEGCSADGVIDGSTIDAVNTAWGTYLNLVASDGWQAVVASYRHATAEDITEVVTHKKVRTQRRRQDRISAP